MTPATKPVQLVLCLYRVKPEHEASFLGLIKRHWPTLRELGLVNEVPATLRKGSDEKGRTVITESFFWNQGGAELAHQMPEVMRLWEPMGQYCDQMEFLDLEDI